MKEIIRINNHNYINQEVAITRLGIDELEYQRMVNRGEVDPVYAIKPEEYDEVFHRLSLNLGVLKEDKFYLSAETMAKYVHLDPETSVPLIGGEPTGRGVYVPTWIYEHIRLNWKVENNTLVPQELQDFRYECETYITDLVEALRVRSAGFHTTREQVLFASYGEAALRVLAGPRGAMNWADRETFTIEAEIRGIDMGRLVEVTAKKYRKYVLLNRVLSACSDVGLKELRSKRTFNGVTGAVKSIRAMIKRQFNKHNN